MDHRPPILPTRAYSSPSFMILAYINISVACQICNKHGHSAKVCHERKNLAKCWIHLSTARSLSSKLVSWFQCHASHDTINYLSFPSTIYAGNDSITVGNGSQISITHVGSGSISIPSQSLALNGVLRVPHVKNINSPFNVFSCDNNSYFELDSNGFLVKDKQTGQILLNGSSQWGLYHLWTYSPLFDHQLFFHYKKKILNSDRTLRQYCRSHT